MSALRARRASLFAVLVAFAMTVGTLFVLPGSASAAPQFDYSMPDRYGLDRNGDGLLDYADGTSDVTTGYDITPGSWHVDLDACASGASENAVYQWRILDQRDPADPLEVTGGPGCDEFDLVVPAEGTYRVGLTVVDGATTSPEVVKEVVVQDWLIVSLGDSYGSGEGAADVELDQSRYEQVTQAWNNWMTSLQELAEIEAEADRLNGLLDTWRNDTEVFNQRCLNGGGGTLEECAWRGVQLGALAVDIVVAAVEFGVRATLETLGDLAGMIANYVQLKGAAAMGLWQIAFNVVTGAEATWQQEVCHRSSNAGSAQAAGQLEDRDPRTSVTFVHLACSGASVMYGLLNRYTGLEHPEGLTNEMCMSPAETRCVAPQIEVADDLVGNREIDAVYVSIGGNDAHFADIVIACILQFPCTEPNVLADPIEIGDQVCNGAGFDPTTAFICTLFFRLVPDVGRNGPELWLEGRDGDVSSPIDPMYAGHTALYQQLAAKLVGTESSPGLLLPPSRSERVFLSEYVDATTDENGQLCGTDRGLWDIPGFTASEFAWVRQTVAPELNANVRKATEDHSWTLVDGIYADFAGHGYCSSDNYLTRIQDSFLRQGDKEGTVHPNRAGYGVYAEHILDKWVHAFYGDAESTSSPRRPDQAVITDAGGPYTVAEGSSVPVNVTSYDGDGDQVWTSISAAPSTVAEVFTANVKGLDDGTATVTVTANDADGSDSDTAAVTVTNVAPTVAPGTNAAISEGGTFTGSVSFTDPGAADTHTATVDYGDGAGAQPVTVSGGAVALSHRYPQQGSFPVTVTVTDDDGGSDSETLTVTVANAAPVVGQITAPIAPQQIGTTVPVSASFTDAGVDDTHTATWAWGDGSTSAGTVVETSGSGSVTGSHTYTAAGTYTVTLSVRDGDGATTSQTFEYVVVFDPTGGFVTGGGVLESPAGALAADPTAAGPAQFAFVSKYQKGAKVPSGTTSFRFRAGGFDFSSAAYEWLVISGARAQYRGTGAVNGVAGYEFTLAAVDGDLLAGGGPDRLRLKVWKGAEVVYDNQLGDALDATAKAAISGGAIQVSVPKK